MMNRIKAKFKNRQKPQTRLPNMDDGTYTLKERYPELGDTPVQYSLSSNALSMYSNIAELCQACLDGISDLNELNEGYYDQTIDIQMHIGLKSLEQQRVNHRHVVKKINREVKRIIDEKRDEINRYEKSLKKVRDEIERIEKADESGVKRKENPLIE